ncbi:MAG: transposase, partial [Planctomycetaceae bacterium]|nr:transposase [Planctomycetaceae bacterium]
SNRKVKKFYGDGSYDTWNNYEQLDNRNIKSVIPPQKNAKIKRHGNSKLPKLERDEAIRGIRKQGRTAWKRSIGFSYQKSFGNPSFRCLNRCVIQRNF